MSHLLGLLISWFSCQPKLHSIRAIWGTHIGHISVASFVEKSFPYIDLPYFLWYLTAYHYLKTQFSPPLQEYSCFLAKLDLPLRNCRICKCSFWNFQKKMSIVLLTWDFGLWYGTSRTPFHKPKPQVKELEVFGRRCLTTLAELVTSHWSHDTVN